MLKNWVLIILFIVPSSAIAQCPERLLPNKKIQLERKNPLYKKSYILKDGILDKKVFSLKNGNFYENNQELKNGLIVTKRKSTRNTFVVVYKNNIDLLTKLPEIKEWSSEIDIFNNGNFFKKGRFQINYITESMETIGSCSYKVWEVMVQSFFDNNKSIKFKKFYSPQLDIVLRSITMNEKNETLNEVKYDTINYSEK